MNLKNAAILGALVAAVAAVFALKSGPAPQSEPAPPPPVALPRLVDLGAGKCIPCRKMAPILEELRTNYADRLSVVFIDVWEHPDEAEPYKIELIPTQIFYSPDGRELFRHEGFYAKEDILAKWKELGFDLGGIPSP
jgi:thioredoxin 1